MKVRRLGLPGGGARGRREPHGGAPGLGEPDGGVPGRGGPDGSVPGRGEPREGGRRGGEPVWGESDGHVRDEYDRDEYDRSEYDQDEYGQGRYEQGGYEQGEYERAEYEQREQDRREVGDLTYWRRRFIALTVGLGVLSLIAWAFSGILGAGGAGGSTAGGGAGPGNSHPARATTGYGGSGGTAASGAQPQASAAARPSASAAPAASAQPSASPATATQAQAGRDASEQLAAFAPQRATQSVRACKPGDVVLSLVVGQDSYGQGQAPEFAVDVVSTESRTCAFNVGARHLSVVVRAHGKHLWASAECAAGHGGLTTDLARGVPVIVQVSWNQQTSARACQGDGKQAAAGSYTASASDGGAASNAVRFRLG
jgi:hypothetical protein